MKHPRLPKFIFCSFFVVLLMISCASGPVGKAGTAVPTPPPISSATPQVSCAPFLPSAPCSQYVSTSGTSNGDTLPWVAAGGLTVQLNSVNGGLELTGKTPCNTISGPAMITGSTLIVEKLALGAVGCVGDPAEQEKWVVQFLKQPIEMTFNQDTLTWKSGTDALSFKSK